MSGVLHLNNAIIGKWFKTGTGFKLPHGSDPTQEPIPKGYVFIKADQSKKEGRIAPIFRYMWDKTKNYWVTNEYVSDPMSGVGISRLISPILV